MKVSSSVATGLVCLLHAETQLLLCCLQVSMEAADCPTDSLIGGLVCQLPLHCFQLCAEG